MKKPTKTARAFWLLTLVVLLGAMFVVSSQANHNADPNDHDLPAIDLERDQKAIVFLYNMTGPGSATVSQIKVINGVARGRMGDPPLLGITVRDLTDAVAQQFNSWDPRWIESEATPTGGDSSVQVASQRQGRIIFPFEPDLKSITIFNTFENVPVGTFDLGAAIAQFCTANKDAPECKTDLKITKTDSIDPAVAGTQFSYQLTVLNEGTNPALNAQAVDTLPAGMTFVSASAGCAQGPPGTVTCSYGAIPASQSRVSTITVKVAPAFVPGTANNTATVSNLAGNDTDGTDNSDTEPTAVIAKADLSLTKACTPNTVNPGTNFNCTITVSNAGPSFGRGVVVTDDLPSLTSPVGTPSGGGFSCTTQAASPEIKCTRPVVPVGGAHVISYTAKLSSSAGPDLSLVNTAKVSSTISTDPAAANNSKKETTLTPKCTQKGAGSILGTEGNDVLCGTAADQQNIAGLSGNDIIFGLGGHDGIAAGAGNDIVYGGDGNDNIDAGAGNDLVFGGNGNDQIEGNTGTDTSHGEAGNDKCTNSETRTGCETTG